MKKKTKKKLQYAQENMSTIKPPKKKKKKKKKKKSCNLQTRCGGVVRQERQIGNRNEVFLRKIDNSEIINSNSYLQSG